MKRLDGSTSNAECLDAKWIGGRQVLQLGDVERRDGIRVAHCCPVQLPRRKWYRSQPLTRSRIPEAVLDGHLALVGNVLARLGRTTSSPRTQRQTLRLLVATRSTMCVMPTALRGDGVVDASFQSDATATSCANRCLWRYVSEVRSHPSASESTRIAATSRALCMTWPRLTSLPRSSGIKSK